MQLTSLAITPRRSPPPKNPGLRSPYQDKEPRAGFSHFMEESAAKHSNNPEPRSPAVPAAKHSDNPEPRSPAVPAASPPNQKAVETEEKVMGEALEDSQASANMPMLLNPLPMAMVVASLETPSAPLQEKPLLAGNPSPETLSPIISVLSGRVEFVAPQDMAQVICDNPFINKSMEFNDLNQFFTTPQPISELASGLQIPAKTLPINPEIAATLVTPKAFLEDLGLDVQNVQTELSLLKDALPFEGVSPYMVRSAALRAQGLGINFNLKDESTAEKPNAFQPTMMTIDGALSRKPTIPRAASAETDLMARIQQNWQAGSQQLIPLTTAAKATPALPPMDEKSQLAESIAKSHLGEVNLPQDFNLEESEDMTNSGNHSLDPSTEMDIDAINLSFSKDSEDEQTSQDSEPESNQNRSGQGLHEPLAVNKRFSIASKELATPDNATTAPLRNTVIEKAQMLLNQGGGTISVEVGTAALGPLEMAIQVHDKHLELKITASSDKAREMLSQELPALRQALLNQSLELKTVEIGLSSNQQWSQSFDNFQGRQQQQFYEEHHEEITTASPPHILGKKISYELKSQPLGIHGGQIQLRV